MVAEEKGGIILYLRDRRIPIVHDSTQTGSLQFFQVLFSLASLHTPLLYLQGSLSIFAFIFQHKYLSSWEPFLTI